MRERETEQESGREKENKNPVNPRIGRKAGALITFYCQFTIFSSRERINKINGNVLLDDETVPNFGEAEKYQQTTDDSRSGIPRFGFSALRAHCPFHAPADFVLINWTPLLLRAISRSKHKRNIGDVMPVRSMNTPADSNQMWRLAHSSDVAVLCPMLPMNIMRCKHSEQ